VALVKHKPSAGGPPKPAPIESGDPFAALDDAVGEDPARGSDVAQRDGPSSIEFHVEPIVGTVGPKTEGTEFGPTKGFKVNPLDQAVKTICEAPQFITEAHLKMLVGAVPRINLAADKPELGDFDMREEIAAQLAVVRSLRAGLFTPDGKLQQGKDAREAREVITAASNLFSLLMKHEETLNRNARLQAIEQAVYETFEQFEDPTVRQRFLELLEGHLAKAA